MYAIPVQNPRASRRKSVQRKSVHWGENTFHYPLQKIPDEEGLLNNQNSASSQQGALPTTSSPEYVSLPEYQYALRLYNEERALDSQLKLAAFNRMYNKYETYKQGMVEHAKIAVDRRLASLQKNGMQKELADEEQTKKRRRRSLDGEVRGTWWMDENDEDKDEDKNSSTSGLGLGKIIGWLGKLWGGSKE